MKLATVNPRMEFNANAALSTEVRCDDTMLLLALIGMLMYQ